MVSSNLLTLLTLLTLLSSTSLTSATRPIPLRTTIQPTPLEPYKAFPVSPPRDPAKTCFVKPACTPGHDDAPKILAAFEACNDGGTIVLDETYTICSPLDLTFLKHVDVAITGHIKFCDEIDYWLANTFKYRFQGASSWWVWGGEDVNIYGNGVGIIDGQGQAWYDRFAVNATLQRPHLFVTDGLHGGSITGLKLRNSANVRYRVMHSKLAKAELTLNDSGIV